MLGRLLAFVLGIAGVLAGSQAPNFTYNFMQNLEGRVNELLAFKQDIESDRARAGLTRAMAVKACEAADTQMLKDDCERAEETIVRYETLAALQDELKSENGWMRPIKLAKGMMEAGIIRDVAENTMKEYKVAVPATVEAAGYAGGTGGGVFVIARLLFGLIGAPFRRRY